MIDVDLNEKEEIEVIIDCDDEDIQEPAEGEEKINVYELEYEDHKKRSLDYEVVARIDFIDIMLCYIIGYCEGWMTALEETVIFDEKMEMMSQVWDLRHHIKQIKHILSRKNTKTYKKILHSYLKTYKKTENEKLCKLWNEAFGRFNQNEDIDLLVAL